jgi:hypothetical protein
VLIHVQVPCWTEDNITIQKRSTYKIDLIAFVVRCVNTRSSAELNIRQHYNTKEKYVTHAIRSLLYVLLFCIVMVSFVQHALKRLFTHFTTHAIMSLLYLQKRSTYKRDIIAFVVRCVNTCLSTVLNRRQHYNTKEKYV